MAVHSKRLGSGTGISTSDTTIYTVPAGKRTIVKSIVAASKHGSASDIYVSMFDGSTLLCHIHEPLAAYGSQGDTVILEPWVVLDAGNTLKVKASTTDVTVVASGAELST